MSSDREPVDIIADWISGFAGENKPAEAWLPHAETVLRWLADEGYVVRLEE